MTAANPSTPFTARDLTRSELQRQDVYLYESPKANRRVTLVRPTALALALEFEFDKDIELFVERPRTLQVDNSPHELSFWTQSRRGLEQFHLLTAYPEGPSGQGTRCRASARCNRCGGEAGTDCPALGAAEPVPA